jgi:hypothetical protein
VQKARWFAASAALLALATGAILDLAYHGQTHAFAEQTPDASSSAPLLSPVPSNGQANSEYSLIRAIDPSAPAHLRERE